MNWYVIYIRPRWELKIYKALLEQGIETYCPAYSVLRQWSDRKKKIKLPYFNGYVFVRLQEVDRNRVFGRALEIWFRIDLKELIQSELSLKNLKEIPGIKPKIVHTMIQEHINGTWNHYAMIWKLLVLKQWLHQNSNGYSLV